MAKIAYFVHGRGSGHASRTRDVVARLRRHGHEVVISAGGDALKLLAGEARLRKISPMYPGLNGLATGLGRIQDDRRFLEQSACELVVTDGDAPGMYAAHLAGLSSIAIGHGLLFHHVSAKQVPWLSKMYEQINSGSSSWLAHRKIAVHFHAQACRDLRTTIARPALLDLPGVAMQSSRPYFLSYFRDKNGAHALAKVAAMGYEVHHFGDLADVPPGVTVHRFERDTFLRALRGCKGVLASAGSNLLCEAIALHKPVLACYRHGDHEQAMNARLAEQANLAVAAKFEDRHKLPVEHFVARAMLEDFAKYPLYTALPCLADTVVATCNDLLPAASTTRARAGQFVRQPISA